jgi:hypothetical protein
MLPRNSAMPPRDYNLHIETHFQNGFPNVRRRSSRPAPRVALSDRLRSVGGGLPRTAQVTSPGSAMDKAAGR